MENTIRRYLRRRLVLSSFRKIMHLVRSHLLVQIRKHVVQISHVLIQSLCHCAIHILHQITLLDHLVHQILGIFRLPTHEEHDGYQTVQTRQLA